MGRIAAELADRVYLTSDNPRTEDPQAILAEIRTGVPAGRDVLEKPDRREAIRLAVAEARPGDILLHGLLGAAQASDLLVGSALEVSRQSRVDLAGTGGGRTPLRTVLARRIVGGGGLEDVLRLTPQRDLLFQTPIPPLQRNRQPGPRHAGPPAGSAAQDEALYWTGETYLKSGDYKKALEFYQRVIDEFPSSNYLSASIYSKGWAYFFLGDR